MEKREFSIPSHDGATTLHAVEWLPAEPPRAVVQLSHGVAEYVLRYQELAQALTQAGFAVVGHDHLGHGGSVAPGGTPLYFGPAGSWNTVVDDLYALRQETGRRFPGLPYFLLGHSMGSFLARTYLIRYPGTVNGCILMGTGQMSPALVAAGLTLAAAEIRRRGETALSPLVKQLSFDAYNKVFAPNRTGFDWLSTDPAAVDEYIQDPLCGGNATLGLFREMLGGIRFITRQSNLAKMNMNVPVLFLSGSMDPVGDCGKGVQRACRSFQRAGVRRCGMKLYPGARHELLHDTCREAVKADILRQLEAWLAAMPAPAGPPGSP